MLTLKRLGIYLLTFLLTTILVIGFVDWKWLDNRLVNKANSSFSANESLHKDLMLVQLLKTDTQDEGADFARFRKHLIQFLHTMAARCQEHNKPKGIILDVWFSEDTTEMEALKAALLRLKQLHIPVYAAYKINDNYGTAPFGNPTFEEIEANHAIDLYNRYFAGPDSVQPGMHRYHTYFSPETNVFNYYREAELGSEFGDTIHIESLAQRVATDLSDTKGGSRDRKRVGSIVPFRDEKEIRSRMYTFVPDDLGEAGVFTAPVSMKDSFDADAKIVILGEMQYDVMEVGNERKIPGPFVVSWALSDILNFNDNIYLPVENLWVILGQLLFFSLLVAFLFALLFKYIRALQTRPLVIASMALLIALSLFAVYGLLILNFMQVIPIGHTLVGMAVSAFLSWRFAYKFLVTGVAEGAQKYDIFISYSRSQSEWVEQYIYKPLQAYTKPDGSKLSIFFDKKSIGIGEAFTSKYMWAIVDSNYFLPVLSEDYYKKNHCRNEIDLAFKRQVEKLMQFKMVALSDAAVPEIYRHINYLEKNRNPDFIHQIESVFNADGSSEGLQQQGSEQREISSGFFGWLKSFFTSRETVEAENLLAGQRKAINTSPDIISTQPALSKTEIAAVAENKPATVIKAEGVNNIADSKAKPDQDQLILEVLQELREDRKAWRDLAMEQSESRKKEQEAILELRNALNDERNKRDAMIRLLLQYLSAISGKSIDAIRDELDMK